MADLDVRKRNTMCHEGIDRNTMCKKKDMGYGSQSAKTGEHTRDMDFNLTVKRIGWFKRE